MRGVSPRKRRWCVTSDTQFENFCLYRKQQVGQGKELYVQEVGKNRTYDQNALSFALYGQIAAQLDDQSTEDVRRQCKLDIGIPILCRDDAEFCEMWFRTVGLLDYEAQLESMRVVEVTRHMSAKQFKDYTTEVIRLYSQHGISIIFPGEE